MKQHCSSENFTLQGDRFSSNTYITDQTSAFCPILFSRFSSGVFWVLTGIQQKSSIHKRHLLFGSRSELTYVGNYTIWDTPLKPPELQGELLNGKPEPIIQNYFISRASYIGTRLYIFLLRSSSLFRSYSRLLICVTRDSFSSSSYNFEKRKKTVWFSNKDLFKLDENGTPFQWNLITGSFHKLYT